jgi:hypothetical protein
MSIDPHRCADDLLAGSLTLTRDALAGWRFAEHDQALRGLTRTLRGEPDHPSPPREAVATTLRRLHEAGLALRDRREQPARPWPEQPRLDERTQQIWRDLLGGARFTAAAALHDLFREDLRKVASGVLEHLGLGKATLRDRVDEIDDAFPVQLTGMLDEQPGWLDIAARTLQSTGPAHWRTVWSALDPHHRQVLGACLSRRGAWPRTLRALWPDRTTHHARAEALTHAISHEPRFLEVLFDTHLASQLTHAWLDPRLPAADPDTTWLHHHHAARGRARAVLMLPGPRLALRDTLLTLPALHARTAYAVRSFVRTWCYRLHEQRFHRSEGEPITAPCTTPADPQHYLPDHQLPACRLWLLLGVLRGCLPTVQAWVTGAPMHDGSGVWSRLKLQELPSFLDRDRLDHERERLRRTLQRDWDEHLWVLLPVLEHIASFPPDTARAQTRALLQQLWTDELPGPPQVRDATLTAVREALYTLLRRGDPCYG